MIKTLIVDENAIYREGLKAILEKEKEIEVIGIAKNGVEAVEICEGKSPNIVLMDIKKPTCNDIVGIKMIKEKYDFIKIIIITTHFEEEYISEMLLNGANVYIYKNIDDKELVNVIRKTMKGLITFQDDILQTIKRQVGRVKIKYEGSEKVKNVNLTEREISIIEFIVEGNNNREISKRLFLAEGTVRNTISGILDKVRLKDQTQLAVFAIKTGIV